jgi:hypothetical protein
MKTLVPIELIASKIYLIRGIKVMLDRDLAELYGVETKRLKEQVRRNIERFPEDFMFRLTKAEKQELVTNCDRLDRLKPELSDGEFENLKSQFVISSWGGMRRANLYAFLKT